MFGNNKRNLFNRRIKYLNRFINILFRKSNKKIWLVFNCIILLFIISSFIIFLIETFIELNYNQKLILFIFEFIISATFLLEYLYNFYKAKNKIKFPFQILNIFDLLSFLPFFILILIYWDWNYSFFTLFKVFDLFRIFRAFKIFEIFKFYEKTRKML